jgi:hypothetical protein
MTSFARVPPRPLSSLLGQVEFGTQDGHPLYPYTQYGVFGHSMSGQCLGMAGGERYEVANSRKEVKDHRTRAAALPR